MTVAVIYARISQDDGRALGVTRQEADCRALCEARGWDVGEVIVDNDTSAFSGRRRPGYETLLDGLRSRTWDVLVVWHPDRLHRRPVELEEFIDVVEASGIGVSTVTAGEVDLSTPDGRLLARIVGSVARKESEDKSRRLRRKHRELAEAGAPPGGGLRAFGFEPDGVTIRESEAAEIRAAAARVLAGASLRSIVLDWRARVPTTNGGTWEPRGVKRILSSPRVAGLREHRGQVIGRAQWPPIIDPDEAPRVRALLHANNGPQQARSYLLTGFLVCGACGVKLAARAHHNRGRRIRRYICPGDRGGCEGVGIAAALLEDVVAVKVVDWLARRPIPVVAPPDRSALEGVEARLVELAEMWAAGDISGPEWTAARAALEARQADLMVPVEQVVSWAGRDVRAEWDAADLDGRRVMVGSAVKSITIAPAVRGASRFDLRRAQIEWFDPTV